MNKRIHFITVSDHNFFPGTLAAVNSILHFHPSAQIYVIDNNIAAEGLTDTAKRILEKNRIIVLPADFFNKDSRKLAAWELKAYAACDLSGNCDLIIGFDSDFLLASALDDIIRYALETGYFFGGKDGNGASYGNDYSAYGIQTPTHNHHYMSTSLYFCPINNMNKEILEEWANCTNQAEYNGLGHLPGHGDQGILNAVIFKHNKSKKLVQLLENQLWSQHWTYWNDRIIYQNGKFINTNLNHKEQRAFHCGGAEKFWEIDHINRLRTSNSDQLTNYLWFLYQLWMGKCHYFDDVPNSYISKRSLHLVSDFFAFYDSLIKFDQALRSDFNEKRIDSLKMIPK